MSNPSKLQKAKAGLIIDNPFFASILLGMPMIEDTKIETLCTNGKEIRFNPTFVDSLTHSEITFVLAHETLHCVFQHMHRRGNLNGNRWNIAADYVINDLLVKESCGTVPKDCLINSQIVTDGGGTTEGVYKLLPAETEDKPSGQPGQGGSLE